MEKLTPQQKKRILLRIFGARFETWQSHAEWVKKNLGIEVTDEEVSAFYTTFLLSDFVPA